jgi:hypothetical protein
MNENEKSVTKNNMGLAIALGAGLGIVFGKFVFDDVAVGLVIGAGIGVVIGSFNKPNKK